MNDISPQHRHHLSMCIVPRNINTEPSRPNIKTSGRSYLADVRKKSWRIRDTHDAPLTARSERSFEKEPHSARAYLCALAPRDGSLACLEPAPWV